MDGGQTLTTPEGYCHQTRQKIDAIIQSVGEAKSSFSQIPNSKGGRELSIVYTKLQEAKMWMGKVLEELGSELPKEFQDKA
jgi:hypothetical protein